MGTSGHPAGDDRTGVDAAVLTGTDDAGPLGLRNILIIAIYSLSLLLVNINGVVLSRHEVLAAQPAREMLAGGSWIVPTIAGEYRVNKPPTMSWLIAAGMALFQSKAEWVARLPALLSGMLICVLIGAMASQHLSRRIGLYTGLLTATTFFLLLQSRLAEADMPMALCVTIAFATLATGVNPCDPTRTTRFHVTPALIFHLATAASFLLKGVGPIFILPAAALYAWLGRDIRARRILLNPIGVTLLLVVCASWPTAAYFAYPEIAQGWHREIVQRVTGELGARSGRQDPFFLYFYSIPLMLLPWLPLAVVGAVEGWRRGAHRRPLGLLLICWFGAGVVLLHLSAWKHNHYSIPLLPAAMPAAGVGLVLWLKHNHARAHPRHGLAAAVWVALCAGAAMLIKNSMIPGAREIAWLISLAAAGGLALIALEYWRKPRAQAFGLFAMAWLIAAGAFWAVVEHHDGYRSSAEFGRRITAHVPPGETVQLLGLGEHHITFYIDRPLIRIDDLASIPARAQAWPRPAYLLAPARVKPELAKIGQVDSIDAVINLRRRETEQDRVTLFVLD